MHQFPLSQSGTAAGGWYSNGVHAATVTVRRCSCFNLPLDIFVRIGIGIESRMTSKKGQT